MWRGGADRVRQVRKGKNQKKLSQTIAAYIIHSFTSDLCLEKLSDMQPYKISHS